MPMIPTEGAFREHVSYRRLTSLAAVVVDCIYATKVRMSKRSHGLEKTVSFSKIFTSVLFADGVKRAFYEMAGVVARKLRFPPPF